MARPSAETAVRVSQGAALKLRVS